jgi:cell fate regulator YaaT (PSP1 superfamily)
MNAQNMLVSKVLMPERGMFLVRVDEELVAYGAVTAGTRGRFIVSLDYGEDFGTVVATEEYDPDVHGDRVPGFRLMRPFSDQDARIVAENEKLSAAMCSSFLAAAKEAVPDLRIPCARLSFGRQKLFIRYVSETARPDFSAAQGLLKRQFGVDTSLWAMGPRDEVAELGGLGPCGRVCCCCSWQRRFPSHIAPDRRTALPALMNGTCGRFKCCLAFERETSGAGPG